MSETAHTDAERDPLYAFRKATPRELILEVLGLFPPVLRALADDDERKALIADTVERIREIAAEPAPTPMDPLGHCCGEAPRRVLEPHAEGFFWHLVTLLEWAKRPVGSRRPCDVTPQTMMDWAAALRLSIRSHNMVHYYTWVMGECVRAEARIKSLCAQPPPPTQ
jgi:hypothetical protein